jgi:hypothetical protein
VAKRAAPAPLIELTNAEINPIKSEMSMGQEKIENI